MTQQAGGRAQEKRKSQVSRQGKSATRANIQGPGPHSCISVCKRTPLLLQQDSVARRRCQHTPPCSPLLSFRT
jgi:hypothetical protein